MKNNQKSRQGVFTLIGLLLLATAWLVPNHIVPWVSFWNEVVAFAGGLVLAWSQLFRLPAQSVCLSRSAVSIFALVLVSLGLQWLLHMPIFHADSLIIILYVGSFLLLFVALQNSEDVDLSSSLAWALLVSALACVLVGLLQWQSIDIFAPFIADLPPNSSIISNVAQRNHFSSICFIGICMLLFLQIEKKCSSVLFFIYLAILLFGIALAQSRTVFVQALALIIIGVLLDKKKAALYIGIGLVVVAAFFMIKPINTLLLLSEGRDLSQLGRSSGRAEIWLNMLHAVWQQPWLGYGWLQAASAHLGVAGLVPNNSGISIIEYGHNVVLDLLIWLGLPLALLLLALLGRLFYLAYSGCKVNNNRTPFLLAALAILLHSMLEYSYAYSYFLLPMAAFLAFAMPRPVAETAWQCGRKTALACCAALGLLGGLMMLDYARIETSFVDARFTRTEFGKHLPTVPTEKLWLLDNVEAYHRAIAFKDWPQVGAADVENYRKVYERYGYPAAIYDYAMASRIANPRFDPNPAFAQLCAIYSTGICETYQRKWQTDNEKYFSADKAEANGIPLRPITSRPISAQTLEVCEPPYCE